MYPRGLSTWRRHLFLLSTKTKNGLTVVPTLVGALGFKLSEGVFSSFKSGLPHLFYLHLCISFIMSVFSLLKWEMRTISSMWLDYGEKSYEIIFIYLFVAALGLRCCAWTFSSSGERGLLFVAVSRLLIVVASLVAEHGLSSCGTWAQ